MKQRQPLPKRGAAVLLALGLGLSLVAPAWATVGRQGTAEFFLGHYDIAEPRFKDIYPTGGTMPGLVLTSTVFWNIDIYLEAKEMVKVGKLTFSGDKTTLVLVPLSLGLRYVQPLGFVQPYFGAGLDIYVFCETNPIGTVFSYVHGAHFEGGTYFQFHKSVPVLLNVRLKYTSANVTINEVEVKLGGWEYGAGLVLAF
jgi:hypothetical protein